MKKKRIDKFKEKSFSVLIEEEQDLIDLRKKFSDKTEKERLSCADWVYNGESANYLMTNVLASTPFAKDIEQDEWPSGIEALTIAPNYAPAILTVGSIECQVGRIEEGVKLFLSLLELDEKTTDIHIIIDKCGDSLLDLKEYDMALKLYEAAEKKYKNNLLFLEGISYTLSKLEKFKEGLIVSRKIVELEPNNCKFLSDLGYSLIETGEFEEAKVILKKAIELDKDENTLAKGNLKYLYELQAK